MKNLLLIFVLLCLSSIALAQNNDVSPVDTNANWMAAIQKDLVSREYHISASSNHLQSPNRAQNLRFSYSPTGFSMFTRVDTLNLEKWTINNQKNNKTINYEKNSFSGRDTIT